MTLYVSGMTPWTVDQTLHNAGVLYHRVGRDRVGVNREGHLQLDDCSSAAGTCGFGGLDFSDAKVCDVSIRTLRRLLRAVERGEIDGSKIVMDQGNWVDRQSFAKKVGTKPHFMTWMPGDHASDDGL